MTQELKRVKAPFLRILVPPEIRTRGEQYFRDGRLKIHEIGPTEVFATEIGRAHV